jgi:hypothetical protein
MVGACWVGDQLLSQAGDGFFDDKLLPYPKALREFMDLERDHFAMDLGSKKDGSYIPVVDPIRDGLIRQRDRHNKTSPEYAHLETCIQEWAQLLPSIVYARETYLALEQIIVSLKKYDTETGAPPVYQTELLAMHKRLQAVHKRRFQELLERRQYHYFLHNGNESSARQYQELCRRTHEAPPSAAGLKFMHMDKGTTMVKDLQQAVTPVAEQSAQKAQAKQPAHKRKRSRGPHPHRKGSGSAGKQKPPTSGKEGGQGK